MRNRPKGSVAEWWADTHNAPRDSYVGTVDVARLLGISRQRVSQLQRQPTFPRPFSRGWGAFVWHAAGIHCWASAHRPEKPTAAGRFGLEAGGLLLSAEAHARRLRIPWVDSAEFWLAAASGDAGRSLQAAMESMGATGQAIEALIEGWRPSDDRPSTSLRMNPLVQSFLAAADRRVVNEGRTEVRPVDILTAFIDAKWVRHEEVPRPRPPDHVLNVLNYQGLDVQELRRRLLAADGDPDSTDEFDPRRLRRPHRSARRRLDRFELAPNPLGHDPWTRFPWGAVFAVTRDGRHLKVDGEVWFFRIDGDGFYVRAPDGRPIGYRFRLEPTPRLRRGEDFVRTLNGSIEILPMPPVEMADWPDRRFSIGE